MEPVSESRRPSTDWRRCVLSPTPDASGTTPTDHARDPGLQAQANNTSRRHSGDRHRGMQRNRLRNQMEVSVMTTACLAWNCVSIFARTSDSLVSRFLGVSSPSHHWTMKGVLDFCHATNALSDVALLYSLYYVHGPHNHSVETALHEIIRSFIFWNAFTTAIIWAASCVDVFVRFLRSPIEEGEAVNGTSLPLNVTADHQNGDGGTVVPMGAAFGFTGIAVLKVLLLLYIYGDYLDTLESGAAFIAPEVMTTGPETSAPQADTMSTWNRIIGWRKRSSSLATQNPASLAKYRSPRNSMAPQRSTISPRRSIDTAPQSAVPLADGLEPTIQTIRSAYNDATEEAPLQVVPNKNRVSYVWVQGDAYGPKGGTQPAESSLSQRMSRGIGSFDAMNMPFFGGTRKPRREARSLSIELKREGSASHAVKQAFTEAPKPKSGEKRREVMPPPTNLSDEENFDERQHDPITQEPEKRPVLTTGGSETGRNSNAEVTMTTHKLLMPKDGGASEMGSHNEIWEQLMESNHACDVVAVDKALPVTPTSPFDQRLRIAQSAPETTVNEVINPCNSDEKLTTSDGFSCALVPMPTNDMSKHNTSLTFNSFNPNSVSGCHIKQTPTSTSTTSHKIVLQNTETDLVKDTELLIPPSSVHLDTSGSGILREMDAKGVYFDQARASDEAKDQVCATDDYSGSTSTSHGTLPLPSKPTFSVECGRMSSENDQNSNSNDTPKPKVNFMAQATQRGITGVSGGTDRDGATTDVANAIDGRTQHKESKCDGLVGTHDSEMLTGTFSVEEGYGEKMQEHDTD
ncbi:uncharacterized protein [Dermacentor albipictus]|uniref:uncharacterized protein n=1 Tax=Dermacentor albipictus TaxID=60249 RepID=UPI0031FC6B94